MERAGTDPDAVLRRLLGRPELRRLFDGARAALESRGGERARGFTLDGCLDAERRAIADLFGWSEVPPDGRFRVSLEKLDGALRASAVGQGLVEVLTRLGGPLADQRQARAAAEAATEQLWAKARSHPALVARPELGRWLDELRARGILARAANLAGRSPAVLLDRCLAVVARLPVEGGGALLPVLAMEVLGDTHALDHGQPESGLVLRAAAVLAGWTECPAAAPQRRQLWAEVGVACDALSTDVLTFGLRPAGASLLARHLREASEEAVPRRVTLRELREPLTLRPGTAVYVCENPSVVAAAADRIGAECAPVVCVEGVPTTAALQVLRQLARSGAELHVRGDFDWPGIRIVNQLLEALPDARTWRMGTEDYRQAAGPRGELLELEGAPVTARWSPELASVLQAVGLAVPEERILEELLGDLRGTP